jgi:hypothetical protein
MDYFTFAISGNTASNSKLCVNYCGNKQQSENNNNCNKTQCVVVQSNTHIDRFLVPPESVAAANAVEG